jgi:hypothetical protein
VEKMIIAIDSSVLLGNGRTENLFEFFHYLDPKIEIQKVEEDFLYFKLSLFLLASILNDPNDEIDILIKEVIRAEREVSEYCEYHLNPDIFSYTFFDQRIAIWRKYYAEYAKLLEEQRIKEFGNTWK